jgi:prevent-host-death family protein
MAIATPSLHGIDAMSIAHARADLSGVIGRARHAKAPTVLTSRGKPVAAIVPIEDLALIEDEIDRRMAAEARAVLAGIRSGKRRTTPHAEVAAGLAAPNRRARA